MINNNDTSLTKGKIGILVYGMQEPCSSWCPCVQVNGQTPIWITGGVGMQWMNCIAVDGNGQRKHLRNIQVYKGEKWNAFTLLLLFFLLGCTRADNPWEVVKSERILAACQKKLAVKMVQICRISSPHWNEEDMYILYGVPAAAPMIYPRAWNLRQTS